MAENVGSLEIAILANTQSLERAATSIRSLGTRVSRTQKGVAETTKRLDARFEKLGAAIEKSSRAQVKAMNRLGSSSKKAGKNVKKAAKETSHLKDNIRDVGSASVLAVGPLSGLGARVGALGSVAARSGLAMAALLGVTIGLGVAVAATSVTTIKAALQLESMKAGLIASTGSMIAAKAEFQFIAKESLRLGQNLSALGKEYAKLSAATRNTVLEGKATREIFSALGQAATVMQLSTDEAEGAFRAVRQMISKTRVQAEELTGQMGERLPGALEAVSAEMGITTQELLKLSERGELLAKDFIPKLTTALEKMSRAGVAAASRTLRAELERLSTQWLLLRGEIDQVARISEAFKSVIVSLSDKLLSLRRNLREVAIIAGTAAFAISGFAAPIVLAGIAKLIMLVGGLTAGLFGLNAVIAASPLGAMLKIALALGPALIGAAVGYNMLKRSIGEVILKDQLLLNQIDAIIEKERLGEVQAADTILRAKKRVDAAIDANRKELAIIQKVINAKLALIETREREEQLIFRGKVSGAGLLGIGKDIIEANKVIREQLRLKKELVENDEALFERSTVLAAVLKKLPTIISGSSKAFSKVGLTVKSLIATEREFIQVQAIIARFPGLEKLEKSLIKAKALLRDLKPGEAERLSEFLRKLGIEGATATIQLANALQKKTDQELADAEAMRAKKKLQADVNATIKAALTPLETYNERLARLKELKPHISAEVYARAVAQVEEELDKATGNLERFMTKLRRQTSDVGKSKIAIAQETAVREAQTAAIRDQRKLTEGQAVAIRAEVASTMERTEAIKAAETQQRQFNETVASGLAEGIVQGDNFRDTLESITKQLATMYLKMLLIKGLKNIFPGATPTTGTTAFNEPFVLAHGGSIIGGRTALVGEQGPELFTPGRSGVITPNDQLGGTNIYIDARGADVGIEQRLRALILSSSAETFRRSMKTIADERTRRA